MTQRDKFKRRRATDRYWAFKDRVAAARITLPDHGYHIIFTLPMPPSWSEKKKKAMDGKPHQQTPDKDNLEKGLLDALYKNDCRVWDGRVTKLWGRTGKIEIRY